VPSKFTRPQGAISKSLEVITMFEVFNGQKYTETLAIFKQRAEEVFPNLSPEAQADIAVKLFDLYKKDEITQFIQASRR
jgi:hypothetical protein